MGNPIRTRRKKLGLTSAELAVLMFVSQALVAQWERSDALPSPSRLYTLAELLDVSETTLTNELHAFRDAVRRKATAKLEGALA